MGTFVPNLVTLCADPKSTIFTCTERTPLMTTLSGWRSKWHSPLQCRYCIPSSICRLVHTKWSMDKLMTQMVLKF